MNTKRKFTFLKADLKFLVFMGLIFSLMGISAYREYAEKKLLKSNLQFSRTSIEVELLKNDKISPQKGCDYFKKYCSVLTNENDFKLQDFKETAVSYCAFCARAFFNVHVEKKIEDYSRRKKMHGEEPKLLLSNSYSNDIFEFLEKHSNNPDSIKDFNCDKPSLEELGWMTFCSYRMTNRTGGVELYKSTFKTSKTITTCSNGCDQFVF